MSRLEQLRPETLAVVERLRALTPDELHLLGGTFARTVEIVAGDKDHRQARVGKVGAWIRKTGPSRDRATAAGGQLVEEAVSGMALGAIADAAERAGLASDSPVAQTALWATGDAIRAIEAVGGDDFDCHDFGLLYLPWSGAFESGDPRPAFERLCARLAKDERAAKSAIARHRSSYAPATAAEILPR